MRFQGYDFQSRLSRQPRYQVLFPALISRTALHNNIMDISLEVGHVIPIVLNKVIRIPESWALVAEFSSRKFEISLTTRIRNPRSTDKESRIQCNPKRACVCVVSGLKLNNKKNVQRFVKKSIETDISPVTTRH